MFWRISEFYRYALYPTQSSVPLHLFLCLFLTFLCLSSVLPSTYLSLEGGTDSFCISKMIKKTSKLKFPKLIQEPHVENTAFPLCASAWAQNACRPTMFQWLSTEHQPSHSVPVLVPLFAAPPLSASLWLQKHLSAMCPYVTDKRWRVYSWSVHGGNHG